MPFGSRAAALHGALWSFDRAYRLWWHVWPASIALLICGWICLEKPAGTASSSVQSAESAPSAPARLAGGSSFGARQSESQLVAAFPEKLLADARACYSNAPDRGPLIEACSRMIESGLLNDRQLVTAYNQRGSYYETTQPDRALADYDTALKIRPDIPETLTNRGWLYLTRDQIDAGLADLNKAIELFVPALSVRARIFRSNAFLMRRDYVRAISDLDESQKIDPTNPDQYMARGDVEYAQKHYEAAMLAYDEFSKRAPNIPVGLIGRGRVLEATGRPKDALLAYERALKLDPTSTLAVAGLERLRSIQNTAGH